MNNQHFRNQIKQYKVCPVVDINNKHNLDYHKNSIKL